MSTRPPELEPISFEPYTIYRGDCLEILKHFPSECVDLIYIDPPFNSNRNYEVFWGDTAEKRAFDDRYGDAMAYITYMRPRISELHRVLKRTGSFYYHCDWHASHYIKVMLDEIFGADYFQNEIVWRRSDAHSAAKLGGKLYGRIADTIFFYSKTKEYTFNTQYKPLSDSTVDKWYRNIEPDTGRRFNKADITGPGTRQGETGKPWRGIDPTTIGRHWMYPHAKLEALDSRGSIVWSKSGKPYEKRYLDESKGVALQCVWDDISFLRGITNSTERLGFPTQKPVALLERIISVSSKPGDVVLDSFCGCGTTLVASENLNRKWLGIDISPTACRVMGKRISEHGRLELPITGQKKRGKKYFKFSNLPMSIVQLKSLSPFEFENWAVLAVGQFFNMYAQPNRSKVGDLGIDGRLYLPSNIEKHSSKDSEKTPLFTGVEGEKYIPIQVKQRDKVGRPDIDKFAHAMRRDGRSTGVFVAFGFSKDALNEISRLGRIDKHGISDESRLRIFPLTVERLIACDFSEELDMWMEIGE